MENNNYNLVESILEGGVNYNRFQCNSYKYKVEKDRDQVLNNTGKLIMKAALVGLGGLAVYAGVANGQVYEEITGLANCSEVLGAVCGVATAAGLNSILGVKNSIFNIIEGYKDFRRDLSSYEYFRDEYKEEKAGRGR